MPTVHLPGPPGFGDGRLVPFTDSIWTATTPIRFAGTWFPHVMAVVRLARGDLLLHSPCRLTDDLEHDIARRGTVAHVVAPNWFHDLYLGEYRSVYQHATFWAPTLLKRQRRSIIDHVLDGATRPPWFAEMPHLKLSGLLTFDECIFYHRATGTLIVADLLMNASADDRTPHFTRLGYRVFGLNGKLKVFPILRWFSLSNRAALRQAAHRILQWNPDRLIMAHGTPIKEHASHELRAAFRWLTSEPVLESAK
jgi:hypothetical protein